MWFCTRIGDCTTCSRSMKHQPRRQAILSVYLQYRALNAVFYCALVVMPAAIDVGRQPQFARELGFELAAAPCWFNSDNFLWFVQALAGRRAVLARADGDSTSLTTVCCCQLLLRHSAYTFCAFKACERVCVCVLFRLSAA